MDATQKFKNFTNEIGGAHCGYEKFVLGFALVNDAWKALLNLIKGRALLNLDPNVSI